MAPVRAGLLALACGFLAVSATSAIAQCVGDCDQGGAVTVDELVKGVNIALGSAQLTQCPPFDANHSDTVTVDELVVAVNAALSGCPSSGTPTPTATPSPTDPPLPTPTPPANCGNNIVEFDLGETCDDGNTTDGDPCPANCRILNCSPTGSTVLFDVQFTPPVGVDLAGVTVFVRYPEAAVSIPGSGGANAVFNRLTNLPEIASTTPNDLDYALRLLMLSVDFSAIPPGLLATVEFDACAGAPPPSTSDFRCTIEDATDTSFNTVTGTTCSLRSH